MGGEGEEDRARKFERQTEELYAALGRFVANFELTINFARSLFIDLLARSYRDQNLIQVLVAGLSAEHTSSAFFSMIPEAVQLTDDELRIVRNIANRTKRLIEERNRLVHSTWFIGWTNEQMQEFGTAIGMRARRTSRGLEQKRLEFTAKDFRDAADEALEVGRLIMRLTACVGSGFSIQKNFLVEGSEVKVK